ncbi:helix-turn-helix domain-containing protein [Streptomyces sp. CRN 30]|uniref:TetR/AcrR family transcriptional regulator n=1 Tax=Streptomyces sp. CRN 30 TaxID=3075613 RepID=UPI002A835791|nr:helix-turn-helix domain-containing protein [Streptomyces sp. CRN 30]
MGRWEPGARERLREAALELFTDRGYEQTTVADIAQRAGVTARTFFRHFADKREVLFDGSADLAKQVRDVVETTPPTASALDVVAAVLDAIARLTGDDRERARARQAVITANTDLRERELIKQAALTAALTDALRQRDVADTEAGLAAEIGSAVFRVAFSQWGHATDGRDLRDVVRETLTRLRLLTSAETGRPARGGVGNGSITDHA